MENTPEAPAAPAESVATPDTNQAPAQPDMHGFTSEDLAGMRTFIDNNGGWDKIKSRISNPTPPPAEEQKPAEQAQPAQPAQPVTQEPAFQRPQGAITQQEYFAKRYFLDLAEDAKYAGIAKEIADGNIIKEMAALGIPVMNPDGSINEDKVIPYLDLKAKTVPAKQSGSEPEAAAAPTVDYIPVGDKINSINEARAIIMQDAQLRRSGQAGHPNVKMAEDYLKNLLSSDKK